MMVSDRACSQTHCERVGEDSVPGVHHFSWCSGHGGVMGPSSHLQLSFPHFISGQTTASSQTHSNLSLFIFRSTRTPLFFSPCSRVPDRRSPRTKWARKTVMRMMMMMTMTQRQRVRNTHSFSPVSRFYSWVLQNHSVLLALQTLWTQAATNLQKTKNYIYTSFNWKKYNFIIFILYHMRKQHLARRVTFSFKSSLDSWKWC